VKKVRNFLLLSIVLLLGLGLAVYLVIRSDWAREKVRERAIAEMEKATGARVEMKSFDFDYKTGVASLDGLVLHGSEPANAEPLFQAKSVRAGLKIISIFERKVDLAKLTIESPAINIIVGKDGSTNFPTPPGARKRTKNAIEEVLDLAVSEFKINDGTVQYAQQRYPLTLRGEHLNVKLDYESAGRRYKGTVNSKKVTIGAGKIEPFALDVSAQVVVDGKQITISEARLATKKSSAVLNGVVTTFPRLDGEFDASAKVSLTEVSSLFHTRFIEGAVGVNGKLHWNAEGYRFNGKTSGAGLLIRAGGAVFRSVTIKSDVAWSPGLIVAKQLAVYSPEGEFKGSGELRNYSRFVVDGDVRDISLEDLNPEPEKHRFAWSGLVSGPVHAEGEVGASHVQVAKVTAQLSIVPATGAIPLEGYVNLNYVQSANAVQLTDTYFSTPSSRLNVSGTLREVMRVTFTSKDLNDVLPALALFGAELPDGLPVQLKDGTAKFDGVVTGDLKTPHAVGSVAMGNFIYNGRKYDQLTLDVDANPSILKASRVTLVADGMRANGNAVVPLKEWRLNETGTLSAAFALSGVDVPQLLEQAGVAFDAEGTLTATVTVVGTPGDPAMQAKVSIENASIEKEKFDRMQLDVHYRDGLVNVISGQAAAGTSKFVFKGSYDRRGALKFDVTGSAITLSHWKAVRDLSRPVDGVAELRAIGSGVIVAKQLQLKTLDARLAVKGFSLDKKKLGTLDVVAATGGSTLSLQADATLNDSKVKLNGEWRLEAGYQGSGKLEFTPISFATLQDLQPAQANQERWPITGVIAGSASFKGPALIPSQWKGEITLTSLEVRPQRRVRAAGAAAQYLVLRNAKPVKLEVDGNSITVRSAVLTAKETNIEASGTLSFVDRSPWDLKLKGTMNLEVLKNFDSDILATGVATLDASVRGELRDPQLFGKLELKNASLFVQDIPNGLDKVNGTVLFINKRATIDNKLTAETGGGAISLSGFVEASGDELRYRLMATANHVRLRYPEGVSTVADFNLGLTGTSARSMLSGNISVVRSGFTPRTDIGTILAQSGKSTIAQTTANDFLRNMLFDVRIQTAPNVELQTSLTRDVQANADLRLRGSPIRPILQGRIVVNQGEINFFGNKYTINRGQVSFFNSTDPVIDMDLETRVRGVEVTINFAGPINKLNVSYRSDPPLQSQEIIALLTVGRSPDSNQAIATAPAGQNQGSFLDSTANSLLGQAISAPVNSRLQRLFGVSRVKIDPQLTGFEGTPQARLTLEQQVSKDITVTFVTNLNKTQQQIVRVEWDLNPNWSAVAVRDENGIFGLDFLYKRRFK
jgi:translocation and assembly module TamB